MKTASLNNPRNDCFLPHIRAKLPSAGIYIVIDLVTAEPRFRNQTKELVAHEIIDSILSILQARMARKENAPLPTHPSDTQVSVANIAFINEGGGPIHPKNRQQNHLTPNRPSKKNPPTHHHHRFLGTLIDILPLLSFSSRTPFLVGSTCSTSSSYSTSSPVDSRSARTTSLLPCRL